MELFAFAFSLLFGVWMTIGVVVSLLGGWWQLAYTYRCDAPVTGASWRFQSADFSRGIHYGNGLRFIASTAGLYIGAPIIFRLGHPPLLIPWSDISARPERGMFGIRYVRLRFRGEPNVSLRISPNLAEKIRSAGVPFKVEDATAQGT